MKTITLLIFVAICNLTLAQVGNLIPVNTSTHTAVLSGDWFSPTTWNTGTIPSDAAIVHIPVGINISYEGSSSAHIFAIRVDGNMNILQTTSTDTTRLTVDTFIGTHTSKITVEADTLTDGNIEITFSPFDIEAHKAGTSGYAQVWNTNAHNHYSDGATHYHVEYYVGPDKRFDTYAEALVGNTSVSETYRAAVDDGPGVLGRYDWDSTQVSLGLITMGQIEIFGQEKKNMLPLSSDALSGTNTLNLSQAPQGWMPNDELIITRGGTQGLNNQGEDQRSVATITGSTITLNSNLNKNHFNKPTENLFCYVGNLTRNIRFTSSSPDSTQRGHFMAMHNDSNVQVKNAAFIDMGRTDKSKLLNDFVWKNWKEPVVFKSKISALGQECVEMKRNPKEDISNIRGRYSIHLHKLGATATSNMAIVTGNVIWGNPGWGITHHDSHADVSDNVVYDVTGAGIVSESGSETGIWDRNLLVDIKKGHTGDFYESTLWFDDYLFSGQGLGMKGRSVVCNDNVIASANIGVGIMNISPSVENMDRVDPIALANRPEHPINHWPLSTNGYSVEGDGVLPVEPALIMTNTTAIWCYQGLRSFERDMGVNHESRSLFDGFKCWGINQGLSITYQADYTFKDVYISGKNMNAIGMYLWKHSHNHVFDNVKLEDLGYGITCSKLVENNGNQKTRNNGFTPWYFIDMTTSNVTDLYQIEKEDPATPTIYDEHGDNTIHLSSSDFIPRPTTFTILDSSELYVDYATSDFQFEVDGIITDELGSYDLGIQQALAQGDLRLGYPERIYEFASPAKFEEYLMNNGVYQDPITNEFYFIIDEFVPDRRTNNYVGFPIRVKILNPPSTGVFANPQSESITPDWQIVSRLATASQSSTDLSITYNGNTIDAGPQKSVDGNTNGRINVQEFQDGLVPIGSFSQTNVENEPWFELDLGEEKLIEFLDVWSFVNINGSSKETLDSEFKDFYVLISDSPFGSANLTAAQGMADFQYYKDNSLQRKFSLNNMGAKGRYIRIQGVGNRLLRLSEIEVIGKTCSPSSGIDVISSCDPITWIDGNTYNVSNSAATFTLTNAAGCDSIVTLDYTKLSPSSGTDVITSCDPITWIDGNTYNSSNSTATTTLTNVEGCDSIVTLNFTKLSPSAGTDIITSCDPITWIDGNTYNSSNSTATATLINAEGCDSIVTLNFTKLSPSSGTDAITSCDPITWIDGNTYSSSNSTATAILTNAQGCDSIVTLNFTLNGISASIDENNLVLTAQPSGVSYQWINCLNNTSLPGETNQNFTPTVNGEYAVIVEQNGCSDTSGCIIISTIGLDDLSNAFGIRVYPNPTSGVFSIELAVESEKITLEILNSLGQLVSREEYLNTAVVDSIINNESGVYFLKILTDEKSVIVPLVKK